MHTNDCPSELFVSACMHMHMLIGNPSLSPTFSLSLSLSHFQRGIWAYHGSSFAFDQAKWSENWCFAEQDSLIEGLQLPGDVFHACAGGGLKMM